MAGAAHILWLQLECTETNVDCVNSAGKESQLGFAFFKNQVLTIAKIGFECVWPTGEKSEVSEVRPVKSSTALSPSSWFWQTIV